MSRGRASRGGMDVEDVDIAWAERDASPIRYEAYSQLPEDYQRIHTQDDERRASLARQEPADDTEGPRGPPTTEEVEEPLNHHDGPNGTPNETGSISSSISSSQRPGQNSRHRQYSTLSKTSTRMERNMMAYLDRHPTAVDRIEKHRLQHTQTVGSTKRTFTGEGVELPDFGGGKPYPPPLPEQEVYVVEFSGHDDPRHAQNFPNKTKLLIAVILIFDSLAATFASSIFSPATMAVGEEFKVGQEVVTLGTSLFVLGYATGPTVWAPISELYGRRVPVIIGAFGFAIFNTAVAVAKDYQTLVISRFFAGLFGSCPLTLCGAVFADMYDNKTRGLAIGTFSAMLMIGPFCGPMVGGFMTKTIGWRWTAWIPAFMGYASLVLVFFFQQESYGPVILVAKASELRRLTRNWGIHAKQEEVEVDLKELVVKNVTRPLRILFTEPIVLIITLYMSFIYGLLYLNLTAYAIVFEQIYGFSLGVAGIPYMALIVGVAIGFACIVAINGDYVRRLEANNNIPVPEWRLPLTMVGGIVFALGLFWFGWTGYMGPTIPWPAPVCAGIFIGFGIYTVFLQCLNYIIDAYLMFAASAIAANTIMRSIFGAVFPLFATYMFDGIGINYGMTLLGCVAVLFIPMPFVLYRYGKKLRGMSKFAPAPDIEQDKRKDEESRGQQEGSSDDSNGLEKQGSSSTPDDEGDGKKDLEKKSE